MFALCLDAQIDLLRVMRLFYISLKLFSTSQDGEFEQIQNGTYSLVCDNEHEELECKFHCKLVSGEKSELILASNRFS